MRKFSRLTLDLFLIIVFVVVGVMSILTINQIEKSSHPSLVKFIDILKAYFNKEIKINSSSINIISLATLIISAIGFVSSFLSAIFFFRKARRFSISRWKWNAISFVLAIIALGFGAYVTAEYLGKKLPTLDDVKRIWEQIKSSIA